MFLLDLLSIFLANMKKIFLLILAFFLLFFTPIFVYGQDKIELQNPLEVNMDNPAVLIGYIIQAVLGLVGGISLLMMVYGGFQWLTAAGNEDKIKSGTQTMLWSAIGLVLVFSSYLLVSTIFGILK